MTNSALPLWVISLTLVLVLALAWLFGAIARWLLRGRATLGTAPSIVMAIVGSALGLAVVSLVQPNANLLSALAIGLALGGSVLAVALYGAAAAHFQRPQRASTTELIAAGESDRVEFKSTARVNLHTGAKDDRMELVIAKTLTAFLNADGGTLIIGVDDDGTPLGLDRDFGTLKAPDRDRFELWLRDLLSGMLGANAAASIKVEFVELPDAAGVNRDVCRVDAPASPRAVFLRPSKGADPQLWLRIGNSTRQLGIDAASEYIMHRWPLGLGSGIAAQIRATARFSERRN